MKNKVKISKIKKIIILFSLVLFSCGDNDTNTKINSNIVNNKEIEIKEITTEKKPIYQEKKKEKDIKNNIKVEKLINEGKIEEARKILNEESSTLFHIHELKVKLYIKEGKYKQALEEQLKVNENDNWKNHNNLLNLGVIYFNLGEKEKAIEYINKSLEIKPDFRRAIEYIEYMEKFERENGLKLKFLSSFEKKDFKQALKYQLEINKMYNWKNYNELYLLGVIYSNLGEKEKAIEYINKSLEIKPDFKSAKEVLTKLKIIK